MRKRERKREREREREIERKRERERERESERERERERLPVCRQPTRSVNKSISSQTEPYGFPLFHRRFRTGRIASIQGE